MNFDKELDVRGLVCPLPIRRTKKSLADMMHGQVLKVMATDPGAVIDFHMTRCDGCGHCVDICPSDIMHIDKVTRRAYNIEPNMCWE
ncbi:MAG: sulfurtransferase TusA family protein, partial [Nitrosomonas halophila]